MPFSNSLFIKVLCLYGLLFFKTSLARDLPKPPPANFLKVRDSISLRDLSQNSVRAGESFLFDINWGVINAGQATLETRQTPKKNIWEIRSRAWCNSFFQTFYPVSDTVLSVIDAKGIYPLRFEKKLNEGNFKDHHLSFFDQEKKMAWLQDSLVSLNSITHDILSAFTYIRTRDLEVGKTFTLAAVSGKKKYDLKVYCHRKEAIEVGAGKFNTIVVEPKVTGVGLFKAKGKLLIWLTDDSYHMPVKMSSKIPVGSISAELVKYTLPKD